MSKLPSYVRDLTIEEFADAKNVSVSTVRRLIASGHIRANRVGTRLIRIPADQLDAVGREV